MPFYHPLESSTDRTYTTAIAVATNTTTSTTTAIVTRHWRLRRLQVPAQAGPASAPSEYPHNIYERECHAAVS
jgi:hypothetical protein